MISRRSFLASTAAAFAAPASASDKKLNVLFIAVDDMRPDLGCYGNQYVRTPNLDKLASKGLVFQRAYCQQAVCSPSRTSLLTGRRPDTTKIYELQTHFRRTIPDVVTLPEHFKKNGYVTAGMGKIFHGGLDDPQSWSIPWWGPGMQVAWNSEENRARSQKVWARLQENGLRIPPAGGSRAERGPAWLASDEPDEALPDGKTAATAVRALSELKEKPFFLAVGFARPHLPFIAPKKYYDLYPKESVKHPDYAPEPVGVPKVALHASGELRNYADIPEKGPIPDDKALELIRGYYAAISYTDAMIGRVIDQVDKLGLRDNTVVIVWGDHGWHLGNHGLWNKHSNFEKATRAPLIISVPGQRGGRKSNALVEFVDIYPSLAEICGIAKPEGVEGSSFVPLLERPNRDWKTAVFSQYPRGKVMGYSMRTDRHRYTEWGTEGVELYDYHSDPDEKQNLAVLPESAPLVKELSERLRAGWKAARPAT